MKAASNHTLLDDLFNARHLPVIPNGVTDLITSLSDENIGYRELSGRIEHFPTIAARLIALANSAWSTPVESINSLEQACARLGLKIVRSVSISLSIADTFNPTRCPAFDAIYYWSDVLLVADIASTLAEHTRPPDVVDAGIARSAGLLHNLGLLLLVHHFPQPLEQVLLQYSQPESTGLNPLIEHQLGVSPPQAGSFLALNWGLPETIANTMGHYDEADYDQADWPLVCTVALAIDCVSALNRDQEKPSRLEHANRLLTDPAILAELWPQFRQLQAQTKDLARALFN
jgi:HD-like signal output (HDOD) protein